MGRTGKASSGGFCSRTRDWPALYMAGKFMSAGKSRRATAQDAASLAAVDIKNNMYTEGSARIYRAAGNTELATALVLKAVYIDPYDMDAHKMLAELYGKIRQHRW